MTEKSGLVCPTLVLLVCISAVSVILTAKLAATLSEGMLKMDYKMTIF